MAPKSSTAGTISAINLNELRIRLTGTRPLLLARGEAANPFDEQARKIKPLSQKKKKTDAEHEALARLQFESSCYYDEEIGPYMPVDNILKCLEQGAAKGYKEGTDVKSLVVIKGFVGREIDNGAARINYTGPRDLDGLYADKRFVLMKMGKVPSTRTRILTVRPIFMEWNIEFLIEFMEIPKERIMDYLNISGRLVGLGAWRPRHGLFVPEIVK